MSPSRPPLRSKRARAVCAYRSSAGPAHFEHRRWPAGTLPAGLRAHIPAPCHALTSGDVARKPDPRPGLSHEGQEKGKQKAGKYYALSHALLSFIVLLGALLPIGLSGRMQASAIIVAVIVAAVFPAPLIWLLRKMGYPVGQPVVCPRCDTDMPFFRKPTSLKQALRGGYRCSNCGTDTDARGRELTTDAPR